MKLQLTRIVYWIWMKSNFKEIIMISPLPEMLETLGKMLAPGMTGKFLDSFAAISANFTM